MDGKPKFNSAEWELAASPPPKNQTQLKKKKKRHFKVNISVFLVTL